MNGMCGVNDNNNNMATNITNCDKDGIFRPYGGSGTQPPIAGGCSRVTGQFDVIDGGCWITYCYSDLYCDGVLQYSTIYICGIECIG